MRDCAPKQGKCSILYFTKVQYFVVIFNKLPFFHIRESVASVGPMPDFGLFEASRLACPVLPQYHPKQLMELLGFGKLRRVKAILSHLVRCLSGSENIKVCT